MRCAVMSKKGVSLSNAPFSDVTERRQVEKELQESERNFRNSMDSSPLGIAIGQ